MTDDVALLRDTIDRLQAAYDRRRADLQAGIADLAAGTVTPEDMRDTAGRSILLDALTALVNARATLVYAHFPQRFIMTNCSTAGHEKIPAVSVLVMDDGREAPLCQACETRRYAEMREASVAYRLMAPPQEN